jgi:hypothetical protein
MTEPNLASDRWEPELGIIFSLRDDFVWATWPDTEAAVRLGRHRMVASMMEDFLAQDALGRRLTNGRPAGG